ATCSSLDCPAFEESDVRLHVIDLHKAPDHKFRESAEWRVPVGVWSVAWSPDRRLLALGGDSRKGQPYEILDLRQRVP
ncbi:MAG: hypothetical protein ACC645_23860, partial [Pirellulales bacterium]